MGSLAWSCILGVWMLSAGGGDMILFTQTTCLIKCLSAALHHTNIAVSYKWPECLCCPSLKSLSSPSHSTLDRNSSWAVACVCVYMCVCVLLVVETLWESVPWNVWAGFPLFPSGADHSHTAICAQHEHVAQHSHVSLCVDLISPTVHEIFALGGDSVQIIDLDITEDVLPNHKDMNRLCLSDCLPSLSDVGLLHSHFLWLLFSLPLPPLCWNVTSVFDLVIHLSHADHTSTVCLMQTQCWPIFSYGTHTAHTHTHTHTHALLRHSPVVWPVTTRQLFLLSCHVSHDVRALLCVIGWRLMRPVYVGDFRSLCHRELWSWTRRSTDMWPLTPQQNTCVFLVTTVWKCVMLLSQRRVTPQQIH